MNTAKRDSNPAALARSQGQTTASAAYSRAAAGSTAISAGRPEKLVRGAAGRERSATRPM
jgi:hypothetical protein